MRLVLLTHYPLSASHSMRHFPRMIAEAMRARGHTVEVWTAPLWFGRLLKRPKGLVKWLGYIDQYLLFSWILRRRAARMPADTLFVFTDQALGMWVPALKDRPHVIHCHDFIAVRSALGEFPEHRTAWTGRIYQRLIRRGFSRGHAFISISKATRSDLHRFFPGSPPMSEVVYNGLNGNFEPLKDTDASKILRESGLNLDGGGFFLHVGSGKWHKNRKGVLGIYREVCRSVPNPPSLIIVGASFGDGEGLNDMPVNGHVHILSNVSPLMLRALYSQSRVFLFPSLYEGFGWPIAEAQACGCPVITTNEPPMSEVGGDAAYYLPRRPCGDDGEWSRQGAKLVRHILNLSDEERNEAVRRGLKNAERFRSKLALDRYEEIYGTALHSFADLAGQNAERF